MTSQSWHHQFPSPKFPKSRIRVILPVDDEPAVLATRRLILVGAGYRVPISPPRR
jgi:hypothetical protein